MTTECLEKNFWVFFTDEVTKNDMIRVYAEREREREREREPDLMHVLVESIQKSVAVFFYVVITKEKVKWWRHKQRRGEDEALTSLPDLVILVSGLLQKSRLESESNSPSPLSPAVRLIGLEGYLWFATWLISSKVSWEFSYSAVAFPHQVKLTI